MVRVLVRYNSSGDWQVWQRAQQCVTSMMPTSVAQSGHSSYPTETCLAKGILNRGITGESAGARCSSSSSSSSKGSSSSSSASHQQFIIRWLTSPKKSPPQQPGDRATVKHQRVEAGPMGASSSEGNAGAPAPGNIVPGDAVLLAAWESLSFS
ncbi:hypothetical protein Tco_0909797 [Tanacetum coccineum]|uniref:Uncharacterized protein n=1 Tax=Tanacetum coccineum TaxID=301880 RepID=A0ABQ5CTT2_9ASTR